MGLMLAPYDNAMRIGQGFNSFTQQICVDDAVVINHSRAENILTNDGRTMRMVALINNEPSAWIKQDQIILDEKQIKEAEKAREILEEEARKRKAIEDKEEAEKKKKAKEEEEKQSKEIKKDEDQQTPSKESPVQESEKKEDEEPKPTKTKTRVDHETEESSAAPVDEDDAKEEKSPSKSRKSKKKKATGKQEKTSEPSKEEPSDSIPSSVEMTISKSSSSTVIVDSQNASKSDDSKNAAKEKEAAEKRTKSAEKMDEENEEEREEKKEVSTDKSTTDSEDSSKKADEKKSEKDSEKESQNEPVKEAEKEADEKTKDEKTEGGDEQSTDSKPEEKAGEKTEGSEEESAVDKTPSLEQKRAQVEQAERDVERGKRDLEANERAIKAAGKYAMPEFSLDEMVNAQNNKVFNEKRQAPGMSSQDSKPQYFNILSNHGVSQTVVYRSFFVKKLSDIANDMGLSAALAIKGDSFNVGGRGSYVSPEKFTESTLNYYISVKVINQSINFKDALEFQSLPNIKDDEFRDVFGDCFISGFLEGGELNALISMKILNKASESRLALDASFAASDSAGTWGVKGSGAFAMAKSNVELNTETTVAVSYLGGGQIKPPNEAWTIESLTRAATRFPDMVAQSPQRTYAILTKYENLRSYQMLKPKSITSIDYENFNLYTGDLMDSFMTFKALYGRLTKQIFAIQDGTLKFKKVDEEKRTKLEEDKANLDKIKGKKALHRDNFEKKSLIGYFPQTLDGLDAARKSVRAQMNLIINRVEKITKEPNLVLDQPEEEFLAPFALEALFPPLESAFKAKLGQPLTNEKLFDEDIAKKALGEGIYGNMDEAHKLCYISESDQKDDGLKLFVEETDSIEKYLASRDDGVEETIRLTPLFGNVGEKKGDLFTSLDFIKPDFLVKSISFTTDAGIITAISCRYTNGLSWKRGSNAVLSSQDFIDGKLKTLTLDSDERITSFIITVGAQGVEAGAPESILGLKVVTNKGNVLDQKSPAVRRVGYRRRLINDKLYCNVRSITFESPLERGYLTGFWGRCLTVKKQQIPIRLGAIWTNQCPSTARNIPTKGKPQNAALARKMTKAVSSDILNEDKVSEVANLNTEMQHLRNELEKVNLDLKKTSEEKKKIEEEAKIAAEKAQSESEKQLQEVKNKAASDAENAKKNADDKLSAAEKEAGEKLLAAEKKAAEEAKLAAEKAASNEAERVAKDANEKLLAAEKKAVEAEKEKASLKDKVDWFNVVTRIALDLQKRNRIQSPQNISLDFWCAGDYRWCKTSGKHEGWNQKFFFEPKDHRGFSIHCYNPGTNEKYFLHVSDVDKQLEFVKGAESYFYVGGGFSTSNSRVKLWWLDENANTWYICGPKVVADRGEVQIYAIPAGDEWAKGSDCSWDIVPWPSV